jgi:hypothetical protein
MNPRKKNAAGILLDAGSIYWKLHERSQALRFKDLRRCLFDKGQCGRLESPDLGEPSGTQ